MILPGMKRWVIAIAGIGLLAGCDKKGEEAAQQAPSAAPSAAASAAAATGAELQATPSADQMALPPGLGKMNIPADNPQTDAKIALGQQLFFDKRVSGDKSRACYSCHLNEDGTGGKDPIAIAGDKKLT